MAEIKREPVLIQVDTIRYEAFDEAHTIGDVIRWLLTQTDIEDIWNILEFIESREEA